MADFERGAGLIFTTLLSTFPVPTRLVSHEIEPGVSAEVTQTHVATVEFLAREGYLNLGEVLHHHARGRVYVVAFEGVTLTAKGLAVLNAAPQILGTEQQPPATAAERETLGRRLTEAVRKGSAGLVGTVVRAIITEGVKGVMG